MVVFFLQFLYVEKDCLVLSDRPGSGKLGSKFNKVKLNYPHEFLTSISGSFSDYFGRCVVSSITFGTNQGTHGLFGKQCEYDRVFNFQTGPERQPFGGFHGSTIEGVLESIGVYVKPTITISSLICAQEFNGCRT
ncbi:hypothetical protein RHSIM_Rhsim02G0004100 [Rhododendron simsii]|uniref:Jacalin-type lectin domain-containing protein n=1 Tax=Rhododendron simsii TaxID=118357 RepID=A0A834HBA9_RHOSS|nr:hypothetical protein RHSIM_Rhsim02G0004100 [Rhododendron simsii]